MSQSKLRFVISLVAFTSTAFLLVGCGDWGGFSPGGQGSFNLYYSNKFDQTGDDVGGAQPPVDVSVVWDGSRLVGSGSTGAGDTFNQNTTWTGVATDPWSTNTIVTNLNPGSWKLSVTVNGLLMACKQEGFELVAGTTVVVVFDVNEENVFTGCRLG
jgi:hypothetical protein